MDKRPWEQVLDTVYDLGGYAEWPSEKTENIDPDLDLSNLLSLDIDSIEKAAVTLDERGLADTGGKVLDGTDHRMRIKLHTDGFRLGHDRKQSRLQRDRQLQESIRREKSNRAINLLTFVLAFVGMAQAFALTAQVSTFINAKIPEVAVFGAFLVLILVYGGLLYHGQLKMSDLTG